MGLDMYLEGKRRFWGHAEMEEGYPLKSKVMNLDTGASIQTSMVTS
jgi:hypothetical protein